MKKRFCTFFLFGFVLVILLSGCDGKSASFIHNEDSGNTVHLTFISSWGGNDTKADTIQQILNEFMAENSDIQVTNLSVFGDDFLPALKTAFVSGNDPDVFGLYPGSDLDSMVAANKVADLTDMLNADPGYKNSFNNTFWKDVTIGNRIYGVPVELAFEGLYINADLFEEYHVTPPKTFNDLLNASDVFSKNGIIPIAYNDTAEGTYLYQNIAANIGGKDAIENPFQNGHIAACYIDAMNDMKLLYEHHAFPEDYVTLNSNERNSLFKTKKAAMITQGSWYSADVSDDPNVDFIQFPNCQQNNSVKNRVIYGLGAGVFHISTKTYQDPAKHKAAEKLLKFITSTPSVTLLAEKTGMLSAVNIGKYTNYDRLTQQGLAIIKNAQERIGQPDTYIARPAWEDVIVKDFPDVLTDTMKPENAWTAAEKDGAAQVNGTAEK